MTLNMRLGPEAHTGFGRGGDAPKKLIPIFLGDEGEELDVSQQRTGSHSQVVL